NQKHIALTNIATDNVPVVIDSSAVTRPEHRYVCDDSNHKDHGLNDAGHTLVLSIKAVHTSTPSRHTLVKFDRRFRSALRAQESHYENSAGCPVQGDQEYASYTVGPGQLRTG